MRRRPVTQSLRLLAVLAIGAACLGASAGASAAAPAQDYVVILEDGTNVTAKVAAERNRDNAVSDVFRSSVDGFVAELDAADVSRLRNDPQVLVVERDRLVSAFDATSAGVAPAGAKVGSAIPGRFIVTLDPGTRPAAFAAAANTTPLAIFTHAINGYTADLSSLQVAKLAKDPAVLRIEPDRVVAATTTQSGATWGLDRIDQRQLPLNGLYTYTQTGAGVTAYIIDTGILATHTQFGGRVLSGYDAIGDGNGSSDCNGHGTHVAGTVGGSTYGVAKGVSLVPVRVLSCAGSGSTTGVIAGIDWVVANHAAGTPAVANMSLGGGASPTLDAAVQRGISDGVTFAVAAGNDGADACNTSPARTPQAITVGATGSTDARASFSNTGACVDLFAPGLGITSSWWSSTTATNTISGTSMATPHVAGAAALLLAADPTASPATIASRMLANATPSVVTDPGVGSPNLLLAAVALTPTPVTLPTAPRNLAATPANARITLAFDVPADAGGAAITDYVIQQSVAGGAWTTIADGVSSLTSLEVTGLTNGTVYGFRVAAVNSAGQSPYSSSVSATPAAGLSNDDFQDATTLSGTSVSASGSTATATRQTGEPAHGGTGGAASIWYRWTAPANGTLVLTTQGSTFDTLLGVYTGTSVDALTTLAQNDDVASGTLWSKVTINVTSGASYAIAIDGWGGARGATTLNAAFTAAPVLTNDNFADATTLTGTAGTKTGSTANATHETGEPGHGGAGGAASIWYRWTAPANGTLTLTTQGSAFDTLLGAYTGSTVAGLTTIAQNDDVSGGTWSSVAFAVTTGTSYAIAIDGWNGARGDTVLNHSFTEALPPAAPSAPLNVVGTPGNARIAIGWAAPASDGGSAITRYTATATPGSAKCVTNGTRACTITGLTNGTAYTITVTATNATGTSVPSAPSAAVTPNGRTRSPRAASWGLDRLDQRNLPLDGTMDPSSAATSAANGAGVTAYVIDTGVRSDHEQFGGRVRSGFVSVNQGQDDGNGSEDCNGHGTHVSGTIGGADYGVAPEVDIVPVRVLNCGGSGYTSDVIAGLNWVAANHAAGQLAVANMSLGGGYSAAINAAVQGVIDDGVTMVVAAGNSNDDACSASPASTPGAITVGATDQNDQRAYFSNYGRCVDLFAPGVDILSSDAASSTSTATLSGTSMASPHVAGAVALQLAASRSTSADVTSAAITTAASRNRVGDAGDGSPNRLLYIGTAVDTEAPLAGPITSPITAPGTPIATPVASLNRLTVSFRAARGSSTRGTYIISGSASHDGTLRVTLTRPTKGAAATARRAAAPTVLTFSVRKGPFTISTAALPKGAALSLLYTPANTTIAPIVAAPVVQRTITGTQTHLAAKSAAARR
ncbi:MAG: S8 family serine peptidase [Thermoleophilia bacterium]